MSSRIMPIFIAVHLFPWNSRVFTKFPGFFYFLVNPLLNVEELFYEYIIILKFIYGLFDFIMTLLYLHKKLLHRTLIENVIKNYKKKVEIMYWIK